MTAVRHCLQLIGELLLWVLTIPRRRRWRADAAAWQTEQDDWRAGATS